jgi:hypothetical protein
MPTILQSSHNQGDRRSLKKPARAGGSARHGHNQPEETGGRPMTQKQKIEELERKAAWYRDAFDSEVRKNGELRLEIEEFKKAWSDISKCDFDYIQERKKHLPVYIADQFNGFLYGYGRPNDHGYNHTRGHNHF